MPFISSEIASELYYSTSQPGSQYTLHKQGPASTLDLNRLLRTTSPYVWKTQSREATPKQPKKIILSDFQFPDQLATDDYSNHYYLVSELMNKDFEVYILTLSGKLKRILPHRWECYSNHIANLFAETTFATKNHINEALVALGTDPEHYYVLDHATTQRWLTLEKKPHEPPSHLLTTPYSLTISYADWQDKTKLNKILASVDLTTVKTLFIQFNPYKKNNITRNEITELKKIVDFFPETLAKIHLLDVTSLPDLSSIKKITGLKLSHKATWQKLPALPPNLEDLRIDNREKLGDIDLTHYHKLHTFHIKGWPEIKSAPKLPLSIKNICLKTYQPLSSFPGLDQFVLHTLSLSSLHPKKPKMRMTQVAVDELKKIKISNTELNPHLKPGIFPKLQELDISDNSSLEKLTDFPPSLKILLLSDCEKLKHIDSLATCTALQDLTIDNIPAEIPDLPSNLETLTIKSNKLRRLPDLKHCHQLKSLDLSYLDTFEFLPAFPASLEELTLTGLTKSPNLSHHQHLKEIALHYCLLPQFPQLPLNIRSLKLDQYYQTIPLNEFKQYSHLEEIVLRHLPRMTELPQLPSEIKSIELSSLPLTGLPDLLQYTELDHLKLNSLAIKELPPLPSGIKTLSISNCENLKLKNLDLSRYKQLHRVELCYLPQLQDFPILPSYIETLAIRNCPIGSVPTNIRHYSHLSNFTLTLANINKLPLLPVSIQSLDLYGNMQLCNIENLASYRHLIKLDVSSCLNLKKLPNLPLNIKMLRSYYPVNIDPYPRLLDYDYYDPSEITHTPASIPTYDITNQQTVDNEGFTKRKLQTHYTIYRIQSDRLNPIKHSSYRHNVADDINLIDNHLNLKNRVCESYDVSRLDLIEWKKSFKQSELRSPSSHHYFVQFPLLTQDNWVPLPSLSAGDMIIAMSKHEGCEFRYNTHYQQYEVKNTSSTNPITIQYITLEQAEPECKAELKDLAPEITKKLNDFFEQKQTKDSTALINLKKSIKHFKLEPSANARFNYCRNELAQYFKGYADTNLSDSNNTNDPFFFRLCERKGVCRHRAHGFVVLCQYLGIPARYISNDIHAYAEIHDGRQWLKMDLGGGRAELIHSEQPLKFNDMNRPTPAEFKSSLFRPALTNLFKLLPTFKSETKLPSQPKKDTSTWDHYFKPEVTPEQKTVTADEFLQFLYQQSRIAVKPLNLNEGRTIYAKLANLAKKDQQPIFYVESQNDIEEFTIQLLEFLQHPGILIINWERFSANQIASYKSLLDDPPTFFSKPVASDVKIINILPTKTMQSGVLLSRVKEIPWPNALPRLTMSHHLPAPPISERKNFEIDLYGQTDYWQKYLLGEMQLTSTGAVFKEGALIKALRDHQSEIILKDAPIHDVDFQSFLHRLLTERIIYVNDEKIAIPENVTFHLLPAAANPSLPQQLTPVEFSQIPVNSDIFYLSPHKISQLLQQTSIDESGKLQSCPGWLMQPGKHKTIVLTAPLNTGEKRLLYQIIESSNVQVNFCDISLTSEPKITLSTLKLPESGSYIIETEDPAFVSQSLSESKVIKINLQSNAADLIEAIDCIRQSSDTGISVKFSYKIQQIAADLLSGKTIVLEGHLSRNLYEALESVFATQPTLSLMNSPTAKSITGRVIVVTPPLNYPIPLVAQQKHSFAINANTLWDEYAQKLQQEVPAFNPEIFTKIRRFYDLAEKISHGQMGTPPILRLNYLHIKQFIQTLTESKSITNDNPIKSLFHHDYAKDSEAYAYLNVLAKELFGQEIASPAYRQEKLATYPNTDEYRWRRANCLNASALRELKIIASATSDVSNIVNHWVALHGENTIAANHDPQKKLLQRLENHLYKNHIVVLKGPPGSGKTYLALKYAKQPGKKIFWGEKDATAWLQSQPAENEEAILIVDEANMSVPGTWDLITQAVSKQHKIIFTCNPENYPGRSYHPVLQDSPTLYVKSWTDHGLKQHILTPLCRSHPHYHQESHHHGLDKLIAAYHLAKEFLPLDTLSIRDLQQLACRWLTNLHQGHDPIESAYLAALAEWSHSFHSMDKAQQFNTSLTELFPSCKNQKRQNPLFTDTNFYLSPTRQILLEHIVDDILLSKNNMTTTIDNAPLVKSGVVLEGPSGIGKSRMMQQVLTSLGMKPCTTAELLESKTLDFSSSYIQFTVSGNLMRDTEILQAAFNKGCKVILDELNLDPALETLLNHYLTGKSPLGVRPTTQGFFVLASQNSITSEGTQTVSKALLNRLHVLHAHDDTKNDLVTIAGQALPTVDPKVRSNIVDAYLHQKTLNPLAVNSRTFFKGMQVIQNETCAMGDKTISVSSERIINRP